MTTDKNYITQARTAIWSARKYTDLTTELIITILCSKELNQASRNRVLELENRWDNLIIKFYEVNEDDFSKVHGNAHISVAAYYRLIAANILETDKCIYLDCDLIVTLDLNELYKIDISDSYVGGVLDMNYILQPDFAYQNIHVCDINDFSDYINTGVLLMNLNLMRRECIVEKFLMEMVCGKNPWLDQDVINRVCHEKIHLLDWTFNHIAGYSDEDYIWQFGKTERGGRGEIYHWAGGSKAWNNFSLWQAEIWWKIAKEALEPDVYEEYYRFADKRTRQVFFSEIAEQCKNQKEIVIVGFSNNGVRVMCYLRRYGITGKIVFCDNNGEKTKMQLMGYQVLTVVEAISKYKSAIWINAVQNERDKVNMQIRSMGIPEEQILEYHVMTSDYYLILGSEYMKRGLEEKMYLQR